MPVVLAVAVGGALGAASRYGLDRLIEHRSFDGWVVTLERPGSGKHPVVLTTT